MLVPRKDLLGSLDDGVPLLCDLTEYYPFRVPVTICSQKYVVLFGSVIDTPYTHTIILSNSGSRDTYLAHHCSLRALLRVWYRVCPQKMC